MHEKQTTLKILFKRRSDELWAPDQKVESSVPRAQAATVGLSEQAF